MNAVNGQAAPTPSALSAAASRAMPARATTDVPVELLPVVIEASSGRVLTRGVAAIRQSSAGWTARVSQLNRPGVIASMFFSERSRDVVLRLDDGRHARARIAGTSFTASRERVCDLAGTEPLARAPA